MEQRNLLTTTEQDAPSTGVWVVGIEDDESEEIRIPFLSLTTLVLAQMAPVHQLSDAEIEGGVASTPGLISAEQVKLGIEKWTEVIDGGLL